MVNSASINTMKSMSADEMRSLGKFIRSPYFNESPVLTALFEILRKYYPSFAARTLTKEKIYRRLYPGKKYNDDTMRKLLSDLQRLLEDFFSHSALSESLFDKKIYLMEKLDNKKLEKQFDRILLGVEENYQTGKDICEEYFERGFAATTKKLNHIIGAGEMGQYNVQDKVIEAQNARFRYFIAEALIKMLKMGQDYISTARFYSIDYSSQLTGKFLENLKLEKLIEEFRKDAPEYYPIIMIYYYNYLIQKASDSDYDDSVYHSLKELVVNNMEGFSLYERKIHMLFLENGCLAKVRAGRKDFLKEQHDIYKIMLKNKLYVYRESDNMTTSRFLKILRNAIEINEYAWAESFIEDFSKELSADIILNMKNYSYAQIHFSRGSYDKALEFASKVKFLTFNLNFQTKILKLKSCYELGYMEEILYQFDSYKRTLQNDTVSPPEAKEKFHGFLLLLKKLVTHRISEKSGPDLTSELPKIKKADIYERAWIEEKLKKLLQ